MFSSATLVVGRYHATNIACCNLLSRSVGIFFCLLCTALRAALVHAFMLTMFSGQCFKTVVWVAERGRHHGLTGPKLCLEWYYYWGHFCYTGIPTVFTFRFWFFCTKVESWNCWKCMSDEIWLLSMDFNNVFCLVRVCVCVWKWWLWACGFSELFIILSDFWQNDAAVVEYVDLVQRHSKEYESLSRDSAKMHRCSGSVSANAEAHMNACYCAHNASY